MLARSAFVTQVARRVATQQTRKMGGHAHGPDTSYDQTINAKFMLPPVPKDGIFRRKRLDMANNGPWNRNADAYVLDSKDLMPWFDRNSGQHLTPPQQLMRWPLYSFLVLSPAIFLTIFQSPVYFPSFYSGIYDRSKFAPPQPLPELVSHPHSKARQLITEF